jgi:hypothetical protein
MRGILLVKRKNLTLLGTVAATVPPPPDEIPSLVKSVDSWRYVRESLIAVRITEEQTARTNAERTRR